MNTFPMPISEETWDAKYRLKEADGTIIDHSVQNTWERVALALAEAEAADDEDLKSNEMRVGDYAAEFYEALEDFVFLPAGRIIAGAGTDRDVTLFNCYVMGTIGDSLDSILEHLKEAALTMQQGGGIGYDFSTIRPQGALVRGVAADASGPLTFMDCWDTMCKTIMSAGGRRGAMMATMRCDHPDIIRFIEAKRDPLRLRYFNVSVLATDDFMEAVVNDGPWDLKFEGKVYETVSARELWDRIMENTYSHAEPGVIFIDRINDTNNLRYIEKIAATNPCGEQPLPPYGACLLGSINMAKLVRHPFTSMASISARELDEKVRTAVRMMDNVIDVSNFPLPAQEAEAKDKRRIGLGMTGLADALLMMGIEYGSEEAAEQAEEWARAVAISAYWASVEIAEEKGPFPAFEANGFLAPGTFAGTKLPPDLKAAIRQHGIRNSHLTSIAPTGTISLFGGNVSSGIEPIFAASYTRNVTQKDGTRVPQEVVDYAVHLWRKTMGYDEGQELPPAYVDAQSLKPEAHVLMQAAVQQYVDSSISKTINVPEDISFEDFKDVYMLAYETGCKGCTTYRPNDITGSILSVDSTPKQAEEKSDVGVAAGMGLGPDYLESRPDALDGTTYKLKFGGSAHALYITITDYKQPDGSYRPFEVFINTKDPSHQQWMHALTRMISAVFRRGGDVSFVAQELQEVFDPQGGAFHKGKYVPSLVAAIGGVIEKHMETIGFLGDGQGELALDMPPDVDVEFRSARLAYSTTMGTMCSKCFSYNTKLEAGCWTCLDCGHSKCG